MIIKTHTETHHIDNFSSLEIQYKRLLIKVDERFDIELEFECAEEMRKVYGILSQWKIDKHRVDNSIFDLTVIGKPCT